MKYIINYMSIIYMTCIGRREENLENRVPDDDNG